MSLPLEFDPDFYRRAYPDLAELGDEQLREHFYAFGIAEGRFGNLHSGRPTFLELVAEAGTTLEIGPFFAPVTGGDNAKYFDVLSKEELVERGTELGHDIAQVPHIDFVSPNGDLSIVDEQFDAVVSSHCIEHQPSLVKHLNDVDRILKPGGKFFLIVPDKRFCFDHFLPLSTIADVLDANDDRVVHSMRNLVEHRAMVTHNDPTRHWAGDHGGPLPNRVQLIAAAMAEHSPTDYIDVHAWKFVPETFRSILTDLVGLGLTNLLPERVWNTPKDCHEFCAVLGKADEA